MAMVILKCFGVFWDPEQKQKLMVITQFPVLGKTMISFVRCYITMPVLICFQTSYLVVISKQIAFLMIKITLSKYLNSHLHLSTKASGALQQMKNTFQINSVDILFSTLRYWQVLRTKIPIRFKTSYCFDQELRHRSYQQMLCSDPHLVSPAK